MGLKKIFLSVIMLGVCAPFSSYADEFYQPPHWEEMFDPVWKVIRHTHDTQGLIRQVGACYHDELAHIDQQTPSSQKDYLLHRRQAIMSSLMLKSCYMEDLYLEYQLDYLSERDPTSKGPYDVNIRYEEGSPVRDRLVLYRSLLFPSFKEQKFIVKAIRIASPPHYPSLPLQ